MNRLMRRMARFGKTDPKRQFEKGVTDANAPPDVMSPRAKSTGHGKKTADKWNQ